jgi:hypothetical protein
VNAGDAVSWNANGAVSAVFPYRRIASSIAQTTAPLPTYGNIDLPRPYYPSESTSNGRCAWWMAPDMSLAEDDKLRTAFWYSEKNLMSAVGVDTPFASEDGSDWVEGTAVLQGYNGAWLGPTLEVTADESLLVVWNTTKYAGVNNSYRDNTGGLLTSSVTAGPDDHNCVVQAGIVPAGTYVLTNMQTNWPSDNNHVSAVAIPLVGGGGKRLQQSIVIGG